MKKMTGFTLIEILVVIAIISILSSIAIYNYRNYLLRAHRSDAIKLLLDTAAREENYYSFKYKYTDDLSDLGQIANQTEYGYYKLSIILSDSGKTYTLQAKPIGAQENDSCGTFELNSDGEKLPTLSGCWN